MDSVVSNIIDKAIEEKTSEAELISLLERESIDVEDMANLSVMDEDEENTLWQRIGEGDKRAEDELKDKHMVLVSTIALEYLDEGLPLLELIALGKEGLDTAVTRYDKRVGYAFAVHAVWWIRQTIVRGCK